MSRSIFPTCFLIAALVACSDPAPPPPAVVPPKVEAEATPALPSSTSTNPVTEPSGPFFDTAKPGEELPTSKTTPGPIPTAFRHVWAPDRKACTADPSPTRIAVAPGAIRWYEGRSVVVSANTSLEQVVALQVDHTSEGATTREAHTLSLDPVKKTLSYDRNGQVATYIRCD